MKKLLEFLVKEITNSKDCTIEENQDGGHTSLIIKAPKDVIGLLIGKGGSTIKAIRSLLKVKATLEKAGVSVSVEEK